jgi:MYXO-CTERM domain-containing protein
MCTGKYSFAHRLVVAAFSIVGFAGGPAAASTVSYTFSQGGWSDAAGDTGTLTGSFTGTPESGGDLQLADLTSFTADFHETGPLGANSFIFNLVDTTGFSYDPTNGLEFAAGSAASDIQLCSGGSDTNAVCFGISPTSGLAVDAFGFFDDLPDFGQTTTKMDATVTQVSSTPEPGSTGLVAAAGVALLGVGVFRRRRFAHQS